jgi:hypothetical protein
MAHEIVPPWQPGEHNWFCFQKSNSEGEGYANHNDPQKTLHLCFDASVGGVRGMQSAKLEYE